MPQAFEGRSFLRAVSIMLGCAGFAGPVFAQEIIPEGGDTVESRTIAQAGATGIKVGGFTAYPVATGQVVYDSNIRASQVLEKSDGYVTVQPSISLRSDWAVHQLDISASGEARRYFDTPRENSEQGELKASGRIEIDRTFFLTGDAMVAQRIETRGSIGDVVLNGEPIGFRQLDFGGDITKTLGRFLVRVGGGINDFNYSSVTLDDGTKIDLNYRDYRTRVARARLGYQVGPGVRAFVNGSVNDARYPDGSRNAGRNSDGWEVLGGVSFGLTPLLYGEVGAGYLRQSFADPIYPVISGFSYRARVSWNPTALWAVTLNGQRSIQRGPLEGVAGVSVSEVRATTDYELLRELILSGSVGFSRASYRGLDRVENRWSLSGSAKYRLYDHVGLLVGADFRKSSSPQAGARRYNDATARIGISLEA